MPGLENKIDKNMRFAKCLQMESYLDEIFEKGKEISLFKKFLAKDLVETIDWPTFTRLDNKETRSFEFTGFVYRCKINGLPADLKNLRNLPYKLVYQHVGSTSKNFNILESLFIKKHHF